MIVAIADTHAVLWYLYGDSRLSTPARTTMELALTSGDQIGISAISLAEIVYLIERGRIDPIAFDRLLTIFDSTPATFVEVPVDRHVVTTMRLIDRALVPELPDRLITATARYQGVPIISADLRIHTAGVSVIW